MQISSIHNNNNHNITSLYHTFANKMPSCSVLFCNNGYKKDTKVHMFKIGANPERIKWLSIIGREDLANCKNANICELHFKEDEIINRRCLLSGEVSHERPRLTPGAVPSRNLPCKLAKLYVTKIVSDQSIKQIENPDTEAPAKKDAPSTNTKNELTIKTVESMRFADLLRRKDIAMPAFWNRCDIRDSNGHFRIRFMRNKVRSIDGKERSVTAQELLVKSDLHFAINMMGRSVNPAHLGLSANVITSVDFLEKLLSLIASHNVCRGCETDKEINTSVLIKDNANLRDKSRLLLSSKNKCDQFENIKRNLEVKRKKIEEAGDNLKHLQILCHDTSKGDLIKAQSMAQNWKETTRTEDNLELSMEEIKLELSKAREEMKRRSMSDVEEQLKKHDIPSSQRETVRQILSSCKNFNETQNRYLNGWLILSLIIYMDSPRNYQLLQTNVLPLPSIRTIRRYLAGTDLECGFDEQFFELLKLSFSDKTDLQKHGVILLDEMDLEESVVENQTLTYKDVDLGDNKLTENCKLVRNLFENSKQAKEKLLKMVLETGANTALVFMFQPLYDSYTQPIAVFASRGPTAGNALAQLLVQGIVQLEKAGALIHGVISDDAVANRKFWSVFGVRGELGNTKASFKHPMDDSRRVFVWSDTAHLIKTIRTRFEDKRVLQMEPHGFLAKWEHIEQLYNEDSGLSEQIRLCPELSANDIQLNSSSMPTRLATRIFSKSVSAGLQFYKKYVPSLSNSDGTSVFCEWVNDILDVFDISITSEGISQSSPRFEVLLNRLKKLDEWEAYVSVGQISEDSFLSYQTAEVLRVTLNSTIELIKYLKTKYNIDQVYTGRINQDSLEVRINNTMFNHFNKFNNFINNNFSNFYGLIVILIY